MNEQELQHIIDASPCGFAHHEIILDAHQKPVDYRFIHVNPAFETLAGLSAQDVIGKTAREIIPDIETAGFDWIGLYGRVALGGSSESFEQFSEPLKRWYQVSVFSHEKGFFTASFVDITEQKAQRTLLDVHMSASPIGILVADGQGAYLEVNPAACAMTGYAEHELLALTVADLVVAENLKQALIQFDRAAKGEVVEGIYRVKRKEGSILLMSMMVAKISDDRTIAYCQDVTARARLKAADEEKLRQAGLIQSLLASIPELVFFKDLNGVYLGCNPLFAELVGKSSEHDVIGMTDAELFGSELAGFFRRHDREMLKQLAPRKNEETVTFPDGRTMLIDTLKTPYRDQDGKLIGILGISRDITERKQVEQALKASADNFRAFFDAMADMVVVATGAGDVLYANDSTLQTLGYSLDELKALGIAGMHPPALRAEAETIFAAMIRGESDPCLLPLQRKDGTQIPAETRVSPGQWDGRDCIFGICKDVSAEQDALRKFNKIFDLNPAMMAVSQLPERRLVEVNRAFLETLETTRDAVIGKTVTELGILVDPDVIRQTDETLRRDGFFRSMEIQLRTARGAVRHGLFSGEILEIQGVPYLLTVTLDITERKGAEDKLRELSTIVEQAIEGIAMADLDGKITYTNPAWLRMHGFSPETSLVGQSLSVFHSQEQLERDVLPFNAIVKRDGGCSGEVGHQRRDGTVFTSLLNGSLLRNSQGEPYAFVATIRDVTERKEAEAAQAVTALRLSLATKAGGVGVWDWDCVANTLLWDDQMYALYGVGKDTFSGAYESWTKGLHPEDAERGDREIQAALRGDNEFNTEFRVVWPDGSIHHIRALAEIQRDQDGNPLRMIGTNWDISAQKQAEQRLQAMAEMQKTLTDIANTFINVRLSDIESTINEALRYMGQFTHTDRAYVFTYDFSANIACNTHEWCREGVCPQINELQNVPLDVIADFVAFHQAGQPVLVADVSALPEGSGLRATLEPQSIRSMVAVPMMNAWVCQGFVGFDAVRNLHEFTDAEQKILHLFAQMLVNLNNRRETQHQLVKAVETAKSASRAKSEFLANMSHEIRTPLNGVIGFTDLLKNTPLNDLQQQYVNNANVSGHTLLGIINDILDFSKIEAGMLELEFIDTDLLELLENSVDIVRFAAEQKALNIVLTIDRDTPRFARVDPVRLKQILANLLGNAVKFTDKGEIELKVDFKPLADELGAFVFSVRDTGIGISDVQQKNLFKAFSQADSSTTRKYGGTGLGLTISEMIAKKMGSTIKLSSKPGEGTTFFFELKAAVKEGETIDTNQIASIKQCLIIDGNAKTRAMIEQMLQGWRVPFESCDNGLEALQRLETSGAVDVIICDADMPFIDGLETIRLVREKLQLSAERQPVILLHAAPHDAELRKQCEAAGIGFCLSKPTKSHDLFTALCHLGQPKSQGVTNPELNARVEWPGGGHPARKTRILVVEDTPMNMMVTKGILTNLPHDINILEAENGQQAVESYKSGALDLILMDVQMPVLDGLEATRLIRAIETRTGAHVPIIALTAGALKAEMEKCFAAGMDDFLTKPIGQGKVNEMLKKYLAARQETPVDSEANNNDDHFGYDDLVANLNEDTALIRAVLNQALKDVPDKLDQLDQAYDDKSAADIRAAAHALKGVCLAAHFGPLANLSATLESLASETRVADGGAMLPQLREEWSLVLDAVTRRLSSLE